MSKALIIVESPAKAATIKRYLKGKGQVVVKASVGHVLDLPGASTSRSRKKVTKAENPVRPVNALVKRMGVDPYHDWEARYEVIPGKASVVADLKAAAKDADHIYLATDMDREGEAIAWHLQTLLGGDNARYLRVIFNQITREAIETAFEQPTKVNLAKVQAQQTRRFLDRVVGFMVSPLLWKKVGRQLSAGRVQSIAMRLLAEREWAIKRFVPQIYWEVCATLKSQQHEAEIQAKVITYQNLPFKPKTELEAQTAQLALKAESLLPISEWREKRLKISPPGPFTTSTLQQAASIRLNLSVKRTMYFAQRLYEAGYITYMRTDSKTLSAEALEEIQKVIRQRFPEAYWVDQARSYASNKQSQEAHEAIRPTNFNINAEQLKVTEVEAKKLYHLIWQQTVASQMADAEVDTTVCRLKVEDYQLEAKGKVIHFLGWQLVLPPIKDTDALPVLPKLQQGDDLQCVKSERSEHCTKPSPRYSEASLVKELEKRGIGRPSTYAEIISTLQSRGYVQLLKKRFYVEKLGEIVTARLVESFPQLMAYPFTAELEQQLDEIAEGKRIWKETLTTFFSDFEQALHQAERPSEEGGMRENLPIHTGLDCPKCHRSLQLRAARTGLFLGCEGYRQVPIACQLTLNLERVFNTKAEEGQLNQRCPNCCSAMDLYKLPTGTQFWLCGLSPECDGVYCEAKPETVEENATGPLCEACETGHLIQKRSRFGAYVECSGCGSKRKLLSDGSIAPIRMEPIALTNLRCSRDPNAYFVLREGSAGLFLAASTFPKLRETRSLQIADLLEISEKLPEKWQHFASAPLQDPNGHPTVVRFDRKAQSSYVGSKHNGKYTSFRMRYQGDKWLICEPEEKISRRKTTSLKGKA